MYRSHLKTGNLTSPWNAILLKVCSQLTCIHVHIQFIVLVCFVSNVELLEYTTLNRKPV